MKLRQHRGVERLNVALDDDGVAYASYNVDGTLRIISRPRVAMALA